MKRADSGSRDQDQRAAPGYETLFELGQGGMGTAFLARAAGGEGFERLVVIKRLHPESLADSDALSRFLQEARIAAAIHHANVAGTQQVGSDEQGPFIVLDYIDGANFAELGTLCWLLNAMIPARIALRVALDVLAGLEAVHGATDPRGVPLDILHRDVSRENILVGRDGVARLSDFGVAKSQILDSRPAKQRYIVGKLPYVSPEYLRGKRPGPAADVYAVGVALWISLAGRDPWPEADDAEMVRHILEDGFPPLPERAGLPREVSKLVMKACAPDVRQRFKTAREMSDAIEWLDQELHCAATHREVAAWVQEVMGPELERRRARIAEFSARGSASAAAPPAALPNRNTARSFGPWQIVLSNRRRELWTALSLALLSGALLLGWWLLDARRSAQPRAGEVLPDVAAARLPASIAPTAPAIPFVQPSDTPPPPPIISSSAPARRPAPATRRAPPLGSVELPRAPPARAPNDIRRTNPYR